MQLNGIQLIGYDHHRDVLTVVLECDFDTVLKLDGQDLTIAEGETDLAVFGGYHLTGMRLVDSNRVQATFMIKLEPNVEQTVLAINKNIDLMKTGLSANNELVSEATGIANTAKVSAEEAQGKADKATEGITSLTDDVDIYGGAIEEISFMAADNSASIEDLVSTEEANSAAIEEIALQIFSQPE